MNCSFWQRFVWERVTFNYQRKQQQPQIKNLNSKSSMLSLQWNKTIAIEINFSLLIIINRLHVYLGFRCGFYNKIDWNVWLYDWKYWIRQIIQRTINNKSQMVGDCTFVENNCKLKQLHLLYSDLLIKSQEMFHNSDT